MNFTPPASKVIALLLVMISNSLITSASPNDYPDINEELGRLLVTNMGALMNDYSPNNPDYPTFTDEHYKARFLEMSGAIQYRLTPEIKNHIIYRTERYRSATERTLGLTEMYFPIFEEYLAEKNIPHHIKYLPIVESNLNGVARSHAAAVGLWQFIPGTAKLYGLTVSSHLDERSDTHKASNAAATMLANLFKRYGDWPLALAAYNCGPGRVDRYVKGNNKDFWDIRSSLPRETQMYVPYFMAVAYSYEYHHLHELTIKRQHPDFVLTDSIHLEPGYQTLTQLSKYYNIDRDTLKRLNPGYIKNYVPSSGSNHILVLPARIVAKFRNYEAAYNRIVSMRTENPIKCIRRVNNEYELHKLMKAHRFSREDVLFWNGLPSNYTIQKGDVLAVRKYHVPKDAWAKQFIPPMIESISIASLKVVGLDDKQKRALTAPVYTTIKKSKKLSAITTTKAVAATNTTKTSSSTKNSNPYQLSNKTTAVTAQRAQPNVMDQVSQDRTRQRRLRTVATTAPTSPVVVTTLPKPTGPSATELAAKKQQEQQSALQATQKQSTSLYSKERAATKATVFTTITKEEKQALAYLEAQSKKLADQEEKKETAKQAELARQADLAAAK
ncbi:MAG: transglycosylase SLT domain-containing protein, partial [Aureispira sp.]